MRGSLVAESSESVNTTPLIVSNRPRQGQILVTPFNRPIRASFPGVLRRVLREADTYIFANEYGALQEVSGGLTSERERPCWQSLEGMQESKTTRTKRRNKARSEQIFAL